MFNKSVDDRISLWAEHRQRLETVDNPLEEIWNFWRSAPYVPYNNKIDPYYQRGWPSPWEIIEENKYDDFTKALMIGWTIKLLKRYKNSKVVIKTLVDKDRRSIYNVVIVDEEIVINYSDNGPISVTETLDQFLVENLIELKSPR